jgi:hypothetical protein
LAPGGGLYKPHKLQRLLAITATWPRPRRRKPHEIEAKARQTKTGGWGEGRAAAATPALIRPPLTLHHHLPNPSGIRPSQPLP